MSKKHRYGSQDVQKFDVSSIIKLLASVCIVAIDVAKSGFYAGIADLSGEVLRIIRFEHPTQTLAFLGVLEELRRLGTLPQIVMEPTGSYGDAVRYQCHVRGFPVFMSAPKHTHDFAEVLDGVPSMHDAKAVVVLAKLHAIRPTRQWQPEDAERRNLRTIVDRHDMYADMKERLWGRLEGLLARFWPELGEQFNIRTRRSWMPLLRALAGPEMVAAHREQARELLHAASRGMIAPEEIERLIAGAKDSLGVPMTEGDRRQLSELVGELQRLTYEVDRIDKELKTEMERDSKLGHKHMIRTVGVAATAAILAYLGSPTDYDSAAAFEKAAGLNLKVKSSGKYSGQLKITKRGPSVVRHRLFMSSLRLIQDDAIVGTWYKERSAYKAKVKLKAVIAVTRKVMRALWHMARNDEAFEASKLFDTRRLTIPSEAPVAGAKRMKKRKLTRATNASHTAPNQLGA